MAILKDFEPVAGGKKGGKAVLAVDNYDHRASTLRELLEQAAKDFPDFTDDKAEIHFYGGSDGYVHGQLRTSVMGIEFETAKDAPQDYLRIEHLPSYHK